MRRVIVFAVMFAVPAVFASPAAADTALQPPVPGPIVEHFRAPSSAFGSGNRGVDYRPPPGTDVHAAATGSVFFAGPVAHELWVTIEHPDGLRTSYGPLTAMVVSKGQRVNVGDVVGTTAGYLHFGVRRGDVYIDPEPLMSAVVRARLVPTSEEAWLAQHSGGRGFLDRTLGWIRHAGALLIGPHGPCTEPDAPLPPAPTDHIVILVAGYGSNGTSHAGIDRLNVVGVGFDPSSVLRFSYIGGRVADPSDAPMFTSIAVNDYQSSDSQRPIEESALALAALVTEVRALAPDRPIDLVAHSQGGLVAITALGYLADREGLRVVTVGSPHAGDTLAGTMGLFAAATPGAELALDAAEATGLTGGMEHDTPSPQEMAPTSGFMKAYRRAGVPADVPVTSIGGRWDPIVSAPDTRLPGAANIVVTGSSNPLAAHDALPGLPEVTREVGLAVRGLPPSCEGVLNRMGDGAVGGLIQRIEALDPLGL